MIINNRKIYFVKYDTELDWTKDLPMLNWLCILINNDCDKKYLVEAISKVINNDVSFICSIGRSSEATQILIDEELVFRDVDIENLYLPSHIIKTTWNSNYDEGIRFSIFGACHEEVEIDKVVVLDMSKGEETDRIFQILSEYQLTG